MKRKINPLQWSLGASLALLLMVGCSVTEKISQSTRRQQLSKEILASDRIRLADFHVSGRRDNATALDNLRQTARGGAARRSYYGRAPGGSTMLDTRMLSALKRLADEGYSLRVTEVAGGSHSSKSRHYVGVAFDVDYVNGVKVGYGNPHYRRVLKRCRQMGATEVLGPGDRGHSSHIHVAWSRP